MKTLKCPEHGKARNIMLTLHISTEQTEQAKPAMHHRVKITCRKG